MFHLAIRAPRAGYALLLLPLLIGSASGAPAPGPAASVEQPAPAPSASAQLPSDSPTFVTGTIPCISGSCQVQVYAPAVPPPRKPLPQTTSAPQARAQR
ncbi:MAG TPA: hypothetical protein VEQ60_09155 [Longimicrobium sp.]|nr:hypothetical protein [Longimicrobium sp.]